MLPLIYFLQLIAIILAWYGSRKLAISSFYLSLLLCVLWFFHHMTDVIGLNL